jgi:hypothetical protein
MPGGGGATSHSMADQALARDVPRGVFLSLIARAVAPLRPSAALLLIVRSKVSLAWRSRSVEQFAESRGCARGRNRCTPSAAGSGVPGPHHAAGPYPACGLWEGPHAEGSDIAWRLRGKDVRRVVKRVERDPLALHPALHTRVQTPQLARLLRGRACLTLKQPRSADRRELRMSTRGCVGREDGRRRRHGARDPRRPRQRRVTRAGRDVSLGEPLLVTAATRLMVNAAEGEPASRDPIALRGGPSRSPSIGAARDSVTLPGRLSRRSEPA